MEIERERERERERGREREREERKREHVCVHMKDKRVESIICFWEKLMNNY